MIYLLMVAALGYAGVCGYLYLNQRRMIYRPDTQIEPPEAYGLTGFEDVLIRHESAALQLWVHAAAKDMPTIVYFHGNASHLGNRAGILAALAALGFGVVALSYRGYGKSVGLPSEAGLYEDARAALQYTMETLGVPLSKIMLFGESLGTGVAVQMASEYAVSGLVLQAAYLSVAQRAAELYPYIPVKFLIKDKFNSLIKISTIQCPILFFHGELDDTIPFLHGKQLFGAVKNRKKFVSFHDVNHGDFVPAIVANEVLNFSRNDDSSSI